MDLTGLVRQAWQGLFPPYPPLLADVTYQPRPPDLRPGYPNISIGAGPQVVNFNTWQSVDEWLAFRQPAIWRGVVLIASTISVLPIHGYRHLERLEPTPQLLREPSPTWTRAETWHALIVDYLLWGNAIAHLTDIDDWGHPQRLRPLPAEQVVARVVDGEIEEYSYHDRPLAPEEVFHIRWNVRPGWAFGVGVLAALPDTLRLMEQLRKHATGHFQNAAVPPGILNVDRDEVTEAQLETLKRGWTEGRRAGGVGVLNKLVSWQDVANNPEQSQLLESRQYSATEAEYVLNLPPGILGGTQGSGGRLTYQNLEQLETTFHRQTLWPILTKAEHKLGPLLPGVQYAKFELAGLLRADTKTRYEEYDIALRNGFLTIDEIRALEDRPPMPEQTIQPSPPTLPLQAAQMVQQQQPAEPQATTPGGVG
jgi:HK97 family phage portal protein